MLTLPHVGDAQAEHLAGSQCLLVSLVDVEGAAYHRGDELVAAAPGRLFRQNSRHGLEALVSQNRTDVPPEQPRARQPHVHELVIVQQVRVPAAPAENALFVSGLQVAGHDQAEVPGVPVEAPVVPRDKFHQGEAGEGTHSDIQIFGDADAHGVFEGLSEAEGVHDDLVLGRPCDSAARVLDLAERHDVDESAIPSNEALRFVWVGRVPARRREGTLQRFELLPPSDPDPEVHVVRRPLRLEAVAQLQQQVASEGAIPDVPPRPSSICPERSTKVSVINNFGGLDVAVVAAGN